ncbi:TIR domain-containing protein [Azospirillum sp. sgz302134]
MKERFEGEDGKRRLVEMLCRQKLVAGTQEMAAILADMVELQDIQPNTVIIEQEADDTDIFLILGGTFSVIVNGREVATRGPGDHVGEMAAIEPIQRRAATVKAKEASVVAKLTEPQLTQLGDAFPVLWRRIGQVLAARLRQRNALISAYRDKIKVFIISSAEALPIARTIQNAFEHEPVTPTLWTDGVFKVASYTLQSLEDQLDQSDFAIAIAHPDDMTVSRDTKWPAPRDNVVFELGMFIGRLGRARAILMEPRDEKVKLPSDYAGITTIPYRYEPGEDAAALMAPACNRMIQHIRKLGPNN